MAAISSCLLGISVPGTELILVVYFRCITFSRLIFGKTYVMQEPIHDSIWLHLITFVMLR